jgi:hypothetical protein
MNGDEKRQHSAADQSWDYHPNEAGESSPPVHPQPKVQQTPAEAEITWTASEFIARHKSTQWYILLTLGTVLLTGGIYLLSKDFITVGAIVIALILFGVAAGRKPRVLTYHLNIGGLGIAQKFYPYAAFKSFSLIEEGAFSSITLLPLKRFMPPISIYYDPEDEDHIVSILSQHLPLENRPADPVEGLMKRIRF